MAPGELLHLHRRRLIGVDRAALVAAVNGTHIVGDDALCPDTASGGPRAVDFWKVAPKFRWGEEHTQCHVVVFPDHLTRLQERV